MLLVRAWRIIPIVPLSVVGEGICKVRELFIMAREASPSITVFSWMKLIPLEYLEVMAVVIPK